MTETPDYLSPWMSTQRWFAGKGRAPRLQIIGGFALPADDDGDDVVIRVHLVLDGAENPLLYQVPLTERRHPLAAAEHALRIQPL